ncbi:MAG: CHAT domain-containing protein [Lewinellaceae bacterium]|nr:CHAT domain-containing protein [Lewinellaceae bacterium]
MKNTILLFVLLPFVGLGQVDTAAVRAEVDSLLNLSRENTEKGLFEEADQLTDEAEKTVLKVFGKESAAYASVCFNRGRVLDFQNSFFEAEEWYLKSKVLREQVLGKTHPDYFWSLNNLGMIFTNRGDYEEAESLFNEIRTSVKANLNKNHPVYSAILENSGILYWRMGNYEKAESFYIEAKEIRGKHFGSESYQYGSSVFNLGILFWSMGENQKAEESFIQAKSIIEKKLGKHSSFYLEILNSLGVLYLNLGNYEKAESFYIEAKALSEKGINDTSERYLYDTILDNLGILYFLLGDYEKAESFYIDAKEIREKHFGKDHPYYATSLENIAELYRVMGKGQTIESLYIEVKNIRERLFGEEHSEFARSLNNLASFYKTIGNYQDAEQLYNKAKNIRVSLFGKDHPDYAATLFNMVNLYWKKGDLIKTELLFEELTHININLVLSAQHHLTEVELSKYLNNIRLLKCKDKMLSLIQQYDKKEPSILKFSYNNSLFYKGFIKKSFSQIRHQIYRDSTLTEIYYRLKAYHRRLAAEYAKPIAERQNVEELEEKANALEKELVRTVAGYGEAIRQVEWQEVRDALQPGEAAVEFVHYNYYTPEPTDSVMYAALVLRPGDEAPHFIPLFEEKELQALLRDNPRDKKAYLNELYGYQKKKDASPSLRQLIWQPMEELLADAETVYASPSGLLHRINLGAVMVNRRKSWADRHEVVLVGSTRQLVAPEGRENPDGAGSSPFAIRRSLPSADSHRPPLTATLYGGIKYDMDSTAIARANQGEPLIASTGGDLSFNYLERSVPERGLSWEELPGTEKEAEEISAIIEKHKGEAKALKGHSATEESFKRLGQDDPSPRILHIATHGYFYPDPAERRNPPPSGGLGGAFKISDHPMIRSGLVMAGGNQAWRGKPVPEGLEDGILTAYEVSQVDLRNTELVVLSACETGLGDIEGNEGVYGLQRAFKIAGADKLIMSLWNVPDAQTQEMMVLFYRYWLEEGMELSEAFRAAQGEMRKRYKAHYYWAAFVLVE